MKGTFVAADITIYHVKRKEYIKEPSYVAYESADGKVLAVGEMAANMYSDGKRVKCVSPFHQGRVDDFNVAKVFFKQLFKRSFKGELRKPRLAVCVPSVREQVFMTAYEQLMLDAGARVAVLFEGVSLEEFLEKTPEKELEKYTGIVAIAKDNLEEYAKELLEETCNTMREWGISKAQMVEMLERDDL